MKNRHTLVISALILVAMTLMPVEGRGGADPEWLKIWNEAQKTRPPTMASSSRIAPENEPGIPLIIHGRIFGPDGTPIGGVVVHAYHRDSSGFDFGP